MKNPNPKPQNIFSRLRDAHEDFKGLWGMIATMSLWYWALFEYWKWIKATQVLPWLEFWMFTASVSWAQVVSNALMFSPMAGTVLFIGFPYLFNSDEEKQKVLPKWRFSLYWGFFVLFLLCTSVYLSQLGWDNFGRSVCVKDVSDEATFTWSINCTEYVIAYQWDRNTILNWNQRYCSKWFVWELISVPSSNISKILNKK